MDRLVNTTVHFHDLTQSERERLAARLVARSTPDVTTGCLVVRGATVHSGHVQLTFGLNNRVRAHVLAWELAHQSQVPTGQVVMHTCDQPRCVNPLHLRLGTQADNIHDSIEKGRYNTFGQQKLNGEQVREIRRRIANGERQRDVAAAFGVARTTITNIATGGSWGHLDSPSASDSHQG